MRESRATPPVPPAPAEARAEAREGTEIVPASEQLRQGLADAEPRRSLLSRRRRTPRSARRELDRATARRGSGSRRRAGGFGAMVVVTGLVAVVAIPAYALAPSGDAQSELAASRAVYEDAQELTVDSSVRAAKLSRDGFEATSASDLRAIYLNALRKQNLDNYLSSGASDLGDDYPWYAELSDSQGGGLSPLNYYYRECVDFVAWRLNRDKGHTSEPFPINWSTLGAGDASTWLYAWQNHGWDTGSKPKIGAVAYFAGLNHVAYVADVLPNGDVLLEEYNWGNDHAYNQRVIKASDAYYLYAPPIG